MTRSEVILLNKTVPAPSSTQDLLLLIPRSIGRELTKWRHLIPLLLTILIIMIIPAINIITPVLWLLFGAWSMSIQYCDFCADNNKQSFGAMREGIRQYRFAFLGFGGAVAALTMIPVVNLLIMPAAVIGATLMWSESGLSERIDLK